MTAKTPPRSPRSPYLTVTEVAERLRVSRMTVYRLINVTYQLRADLIGRSVRVYEESVDEYLASARIEPTS